MIPKAPPAVCTEDFPVNSPHILMSIVASVTKWSGQRCVAYSKRKVMSKKKNSELSAIDAFHVATKKI